MASVGIKFSYIKGQLEEALRGKYRPVAEAATAAMTDAANQVKTEGRADIARAGFSKRWQNTLRADVYPSRGKVSVSAAALIHHKIQYAGVFEEGATIRGKPFLWLPLRTTPKKIGGQRMTARLFAERVGPLRFVQRPGHRPLLMAQVRSTDAAVRKGVSLNALKRGKAAKRGTLRSVPMFVGIETVTIRKKFNITAIVQRARDALFELYFRHFRDE